MIDLEMVVAAVAQAYSNDPTRASVQLSQLAGGEWYASIKRYKSQFGADGEVVCKGLGETLVKALEMMTRTWVLHLGKRGEIDAARVAGGALGDLVSQLAPPPTRFNLIEVD